MEGRVYTDLEGPSGSISSTQSIGVTSTSTYLSFLSPPERIEVHEYGDRIEFIYKETSMITLTMYPSPPPEQRVFKIVFSCKDGKWHKSDRIYGEISAAKEETYTFQE